MGQTQSLSLLLLKGGAEMAGPKNGGAKNIHGLTEKEEKFAQARVSGMTQVEAREFAGYSPDVTKETAHRHAVRVNNREHVQRRMRELQEAVDSKEIMEIAQIQAKLTQMALDDNNSKNVQLKALDQLAKTKGAYSDNINVNASGGLTIADKKEAFKELVGE